MFTSIPTLQRPPFLKPTVGCRLFAGTNWTPWARGQCPAAWTRNAGRRTANDLDATQPELQPGLSEKHDVIPNARCCVLKLLDQVVLFWEAKCSPHVLQRAKISTLTTLPLGELPIIIPQTKKHTVILVECFQLEINDILWLSSMKLGNNSCLKF